MGIKKDLRGLRFLKFLRFLRGLRGLRGLRDLRDLMSPSLRGQGEFPLLRGTKGEYMGAWASRPRKKVCRLRHRSPGGADGSSAQTLRVFPAFWYACGSPAVSGYASVPLASRVRHPRTGTRSSPSVKPPLSPFKGGDALFPSVPPPLMSPSLRG